MLTCRSARPNDAGTTLMELMVSMALMMVVGTLAVSFFVSTDRETNRTTDAAFGTAQARVAMTAVTTLLRLADTPTAQAGYSTDRFDQITASQVTFYSNTNNNRVGDAARTPPDKVILSAAGTQLTEKLFPPLSATVPADYASNYAASPSSTRVLVNNLGSTNVFGYCAVIDPGTGACTTPATAGSGVAAVTVSLVITGLRGENTQTLTSTVGITGALS